MSKADNMENLYEFFQQFEKSFQPFSIVFVQFCVKEKLFLTVFYYIFYPGVFIAKAAENLVKIDFLFSHFVTLWAMTRGGSFCHFCFRNNISKQDSATKYGSTVNAASLPAISHTLHRSNSQSVGKIKLLSAAY